MKPLSRLTLLFILLLTACSGLFPSNEPLSTETLVPNGATPNPIETDEEPSSGPVTLRLWMPPEFDPASDSPSSGLLQARLDEFVAFHPGVRVEVRVKEAEGAGGLLDSLTTASAAAPLALPDLIALPSADLSTAALKELVHPLNGLLTEASQEDWYDYARQLSYLQESTFGLPFAGDALIMAYRPAVIGDAPVDWESVVLLETQMAFPAADSQACFTLALYLSAGGAIVDEQGRPTLDVAILEDVLDFMNRARRANVMPYWMAQYEYEYQSWLAFRESRADLAITWSSRYLNDPVSNSAAASIPTQDGSPFTIMTGWVWALSSPESSRHALSIELAEFLTEGEFLAQWTAAAGYFPPRPSALAAWPNTPERALASQIVPAAQVLPPLELLSILGPILEQATVDVLRQQAAPAEAAEAAVESLGVP